MAQYPQTVGSSGVEGENFVRDNGGASLPVGGPKPVAIQANTTEHVVGYHVSPQPSGHPPPLVGMGKKGSRPSARSEEGGMVCGERDQKAASN